MDFGKKALELGAKIRVESTVSISSKEELSVVYTPGVAAPCLAIKEDPARAYELTSKKNLVAVVTDGSAVLGLGNIGGLAGMPVMEGKCVLFKEQGGVDAVPICLDTQDPKEIIATVKAIAPTFGGINLEDIKAPQCFEVEQTLQRELDIPVFHDDQHGTAIVILAALKNALKIVEKELGKIHVVIAGAGAAGLATARLLQEAGVKDIVLVDSEGIVSRHCDDGSEKCVIAQKTNQDDKGGSIAEAMNGADVFIGVSVANLLTEEMVRGMAEKAIVFALANPTPEILPEKALAGGAAVVGTGRSDFANQINNALVFPGLFRGLLDSRTRDVTTKIKLAAADALAAVVAEPKPDFIIPDALDKEVPKAIAKAVKDAA